MHTQCHSVYRMFPCILFCCRNPTRYVCRYCTLKIKQYSKMRAKWVGTMLKILNTIARRERKFPNQAVNWPLHKISIMAYDVRIRTHKYTHRGDIIQINVIMCAPENEKSTTRIKFGVNAIWKSQILSDWNKTFIWKFIRIARCHLEIEIGVRVLYCTCNITCIMLIRVFPYKYKHARTHTHMHTSRIYIQM